MPYTCHICQLLHVQILDNYISIYTSYKLILINTLTINTAIYAFLTYAPE